MTKKPKSSTKINKECGLPRYRVHQVSKDVKILEARMQEEPERINWAELILGIPDVWTVTQGEDTKVAILDTGIDTDHIDLKDAIVDSKDFTGDGIEDTNGHGTHVAGVVAARRNNVGFVGAAPKADLLIAKVLGNDGRGSFTWIADGIDWAVDSGADIISMSLGGSVSDNSLYQAIQRALLAGKHVICAAGNEGSLFRNSIGYPGRYGGVITVASHDSNGNPSGFSSHGGEVDVMAPGDKIWSTYKDGGYAELSGTSMATPFVAGLTALIASKHKNNASNNTPVDNNEDMKNHLLRMATHPGYDNNQSGYGPLQPFTYFFA